VAGRTCFTARPAPPDRQRRIDPAAAVVAAHDDVLDPQHVHRELAKRGERERMEVPVAAFYDDDASGRPCPEPGKRGARGRPLLGSFALA